MTGNSTQQPEEIALLDAVRRWKQSPEEYLKDVALFLSQFEQSFRLSSFEDGSVFAIWRGGKPILEGTQQLVREISSIRDTSKKFEFVLGSTVLIPEPLINKLLKQLAMFAVPSSTKSSAKKEEELGESFKAIKLAVRTIRDQLIEKVLDQSNDLAERTALMENDVDLPTSTALEPVDVEGRLKGQQLKIYRFLQSGSQPRRGHQWTNYETLKRQPDFWRGTPNDSDIDDRTVFEALKRLRKALARLDLCPISLIVEDASKRTKLDLQGAS